jgi:GNAT superfamily N-acetyltransferase
MEHVGRPAWTIEQLRNKLSVSVLAEDARVVTAPSGRPVAFFALQDLESHVALNAWGGVHPGYTRRGIGTALCQWLERRARQPVAKAPAGAQVCLYQTVWTDDQAAQALLRHHGYRLVGTASHGWSC